MKFPKAVKHRGKQLATIDALAALHPLDRRCYGVVILRLAEIPASMKHIVIIVVMSIIMTNTRAAITIDGALSEPEWKNAQKFTFQVGDPPFEVTALVLWDETYFYFGCTMPDPTVEGNHESGIQPVWEDNDVEFYLETDKAKFEGRSTNSFQLLFSAAGAYNDTGGKGEGGNGDYDFTWDSRIEYVVALEPGATLNDDSDQDKGWRVEARLPWSDMSVDGKRVRGKTMGWNVVYTDRNGGAPTAFSWSPDVAGFANNHMANNWGEITFVEGYVPPLFAIGRSGDNLQLVWPAGSKLESASAVQGPWSPVANPSNPLLIKPDNAQLFYRLSQ